MNIVGNVQGVELEWLNVKDVKWIWNGNGIGVLIVVIKLIVKVFVLNTRGEKEETEYEILSKHMKPVFRILSKQWQKTQDELKQRKEATQSYPFQESRKNWIY